MKLNLNSLTSILVLTGLIIVSTVPINCVFATSSNWSEVARYTYSGTVTQTTDYFTVEHVDWKIRWEYVYAERTYFNFQVYLMGESVNSIVSITPEGGETSGITYIRNQAGIFYMKINTRYDDGYTVIVEQDLNSIPEFPCFLSHNFPCLTSGNSLFLAVNLVSLLFVWRSLF